MKRWSRILTENCSGNWLTLLVL